MTRVTRRALGGLVAFATFGLACGLPSSRPDVKLAPAPAYLAGLSLAFPKIEGSDSALPKLHEKIALALVGAGYRLAPEGESHDLSLAVRATVEEVKTPFEMTKDGVKQRYQKLSLVVAIEVDGKVLDTRMVSMSMVNDELAEQHAWKVVNEITDSMPFRRWAIERPAEKSAPASAGDASASAAPSDPPTEDQP